MTPAKGVPLEVKQLKVAVCAVVKLATDVLPGVYRQVVLRPDKVSTRGLIRLGETRGDEAMCWIDPENIRVIELLGRATPENAESPDACAWKVEPLGELGENEFWGVRSVA